MQSSRPINWAYVGLMAFSLIGLAISRITQLDPGWIAPTASALIILCGIALVLSGFEKSSKVLVALVGTVVIGSIFELTSLYTGLPFGHYDYNETWKPFLNLPGDKVFPLMMPIAWCMLVGASAVALHGQKPIFGRLLPIFVAIVATGIDLALESVVVNHLNYWTWTEPAWPLGSDGAGVPWLNYLGWLITASIAAPLWLRLDRSDESKSSGWNVLIPYALFLLGMATVYRLTA